MPPGRIMGRDAVVTAMTLADVVNEHGLHETRQLWPHARSRAVELGLNSAHEAISLPFQSPRVDRRRVLVGAAP